MNTVTKIAYHLKNRAGTRRFPVFLLMTAIIGAFSSVFGQDNGNPLPDTTLSLREGEKLYRATCAPCHGIHGDGKGQVAFFVEPKPRVFTDGVYKFRTTESGEVPTDYDLYRIIRNGIPNTEMPSWRLLGEKRIWELVQYIKTFSDEFEDANPQVVEIGEGIPGTPESIRKGRRIYVEAKCWQCHGWEGKGDGPSAPTLKDDWGHKIRPTDLTKRWAYKMGNSPREIFRTFSTGLNGTPMPSYKDVLSEEDRWHLANYVNFLSEGPDNR